MKTVFPPLSGRVEFDRSCQGCPVENSELYEDYPIESPPSPLTKNQITRLHTRDAVNSYFKTGFLRAVQPLTGRRFIKGTDVQGNRLFSLTRKAAQKKLDALRKAIELEDLEEYIEKCKQNLQDNLQQLYLDLTIKKQAVKEAESK